MKIDSKNQKSSLITGASGFIGKRLLSYLNLNNEFTKTVSRKPQKGSTESIVCDLELEDLPKSVLKGVDSVYHLAGYAHDLKNPAKFKDKYYHLNVIVTMNLAILAERMGVKDFIFVSSVKAGSSDIYDSNTSEDPEGIYGETKRIAELKLIEFSKKTNMKITIIRPALVYGPNLKGNLYNMENAIKAGWFPPFPRLYNKRSMIHVDDLVKAIILIKEKGSNSEIYNATDGHNYSTTDMYEVFCKKNMKKIPKIRVPVLFFRAIGLLSAELKFKINKLLSDEYYSSSKLQALGFEADLRFGDLNETLF